MFQSLSRPARAAPRVIASQLPTLAALYRDGELAGNVDSESSSPIKPSNGINKLVSLYHGDITKLQIDAIVNAANRSLLGGGGIDGVIHRAAGDGLLKECRTLGGCETGEAKITAGYNLPAKHIIHTAGPIYNIMKEAEALRLLCKCYTNSLRVAVENNCRSIAFCAISTGIYGYPSQAAAQAATISVRRFLEREGQGKIDRVVFVTFEEKDVQAYQAAIPIAFPEASEDAAPTTDAETPTEAVSGDSVATSTKEVNQDSADAADVAVAPEIEPAGEADVEPADEPIAESAAEHAGSGHANAAAPGRAANSSKADVVDADVPVEEDHPASSV